VGTGWICVPAKAGQSYPGGCCPPTQPRRRPLFTHAPQKHHTSRPYPYRPRCEPSTMAPLEQQWVKVQQKTFTKWCVSPMASPQSPSVYARIATTDAALQAQQQNQRARCPDPGPHNRPLRRRKCSRPPAIAHGGLRSLFTATLVESHLLTSSPPGCPHPPPRDPRKRIAWQVCVAAETAGTEV
jgi:hypothetical protein